MALAALLVAVISAVVAVVVGGIAWWQLREARIANALPAVIDMFGEYRSPDMTRARRIVFDEVSDAEKQLALSELTGDARAAAYTVSHYLDNLGVLLARDLLKPELAAGFLGDTATALWKRLEPYIANERKIRKNWGADYQRYFEDLAVRLNEVDRERLRQGLKRWKE